MLAAIFFGLINIFAYKLSSLTESHKIKVLSFFGGVAAAYVFLDLLPSLRQAGEFLKQVSGGSQLVGIYEDAIFLIVFAGFMIFFILEHLAKRSRQKQQVIANQEYDQVHASKGLFVIHFFNFAFINAVLSFLLIFEFNAGPIRALLYLFAVSLHLFIANDTMIDHYKHYQIGVGRFVAAVMPLLGWLLSTLFPERLAEVFVLLALVSGAILYHSIKNEVPSLNRQQSLLLFTIGAVFYTILLLVHSIIVA